MEAQIFGTDLSSSPNDVNKGCSHFVLECLEVCSGIHIERHIGWLEGSNTVSKTVEHASLTGTYPARRMAELNYKLLRLEILSKFTSFRAWRSPSTPTHFVQVEVSWADARRSLSTDFQRLQSLFKPARPCRLP